jgi:hypothetical protein
MTLEEKLTVMELAWAGAAVQSRFRSLDAYTNSHTEWVDVYNPKWDWSRFDYRIKPKEPKEPKIHVYEDCAGHLSFVTERSSDHEYIKENLTDYEYRGAFNLKDLLTTSSA